ncbi:MAG: BrnA antitoxin family protein [Halioglobus sp.]|nr:BrnA antitoxin family protein [Halioglobus sp.]
MKSASSRSAKPRARKPASTSKRSETDWKRLHSAADAKIKDSEHPDADVKHIVRGIVRHGLKPLPSKASISLRVDADVLEWFKAQGPGYQTRMNLVLRAFRDASV